MPPDKGVGTQPAVQVRPAIVNAHGCELLYQDFEMSVRPLFFYKLAYEPPCSKILAPAEKENCCFGFYLFIYYLLTTYFGVKYINFTCIFSKKHFYLTVSSLSSNSF